MGKKSPKAPDPYATAAAQGAQNRETAITQQELNMVNQVGPWGNVNYSQTGTSASGTPLYTATTTLSPSQQAIFEQTQQANQNLAKTAADQSGFLSEYLGTGIDTSGLPGLLSSFGQGYNTNFNGNLGLQTDAGLQTSVGPGYVTSYAGADDFSADRQRYEDALWERMAGDRAAAEAEMRTQLAQKGIQEGSAAWNSEMERMARQNTDARLATLLAGGQEQSRMVGLARDAAMFGNDSILGRFGAENAAKLAGAQFGNDARTTQGQFGMAAQQAQNAALAQQAGFSNAARSQGMGELFALRNQPINEITALMSGSQVSNPAQMGAATPQTGVGGVDISGLINNNYNQQVAQYNNQMGGLFGLGAATIGLFSDERLKTDVRRIGTTDSGLPIYIYQYVWGGPYHMGVMAQDVEQVAPEAVRTHASGFKMVDYARVN